MSRPTSYWITDYAQLDALSHPTRHEIVDRLCAAGPMSVREIAQTLGRKVTSIYHHIKQLEEVELIEVVRSSSAERGRPFVVYRSVAPRVRLTRAAADPDLRVPMKKWSKMVAVQAGNDYVKALGSSAVRLQGDKRNLWLYRVVTAPSPQRLARINELLVELAELVWTADPKPGPLVSIGWFMMPLDRKASNSKKDR